MKQAASKAQNIAGRLLAEEATASERTEAPAYVALHTFDKLRLVLSRRVGDAGFEALLIRALALAKAEVPWLGAVHVQAEGMLAGFAETALAQESGEAARGSAALLAQLLGLLMTFIGEALTLRLVQDIWPEARVDDLSLGAKETT